MPSTRFRLAVAALGFVALGSFCIPLLAQLPPVYCGSLQGPPAPCGAATDPNHLGYCGPCHPFYGFCWSVLDEEVQSDYDYIPTGNTLLKQERDWCVRQKRCLYNGSTDCPPGHPCVAEDGWHVDFQFNRWVIIGSCQLQ